MLKSVRHQVSVILMTWCWGFWSCLNITPEFSILTLMSTMVMELRKLFLFLFYGQGDDSELSQVW